LEINEHLIGHVVQNDRKIILELYHETFSVLMSVAVRYKTNEEDQMTIVNNSFMKIITKIESFKVGSSYFSWAKRIAQNEVIDEYRREKKYKELFNFESEQEETVHETIENEIDAKIEAEELERILHQLPPATKLVFNMYAIDGYSTKEIEEELNIKYETVKWHIKEARKRLRMLLTPQVIQENL
jgi:RNA polymerase sigma-70 factor (ECF subfamily)